MANAPVLIDTSIWVEYFHGRDHQLVELVKDLIRNQRVVLCGVVLSELLAGVRARKDRDTLKHTLDALEYAEVSQGIWILAGEMSSNLRRQGIRVPLTDVIVAALALENDYELFTLDSHFDRIHELKFFDSARV